jgi:hypothetical protein
MASRAKMTSHNRLRGPAGTTLRSAHMVTSKTPARTAACQEAYHTVAPARLTHLEMSSMVVLPACVSIFIEQALQLAQLLFIEPRLACEMDQQ